MGEEAEDSAGVGVAGAAVTNGIPADGVFWLLKVSAEKSVRRRLLSGSSEARSVQRPTRN